jgi:hypothetical protein
MPMQKFKWLAFFFLLFATIGYSREFFFVHINNIMYQKYYGNPTALPVPPVMSVFTNFSYNSLYYSKYFYTVLWTVIFFFANYFALKKLTFTTKLIKILVYSYCILFFLAAASMIYGYFVNEQLQDTEYTLSRWLLGIAQSPIICLILLASEKLYNKSFQS